jgi:protein-L-isoaspartate(D-aspartate) O-methyltransferase
MNAPQPDTPLDMAEARAVMVDGQLRPNKVTDPRILNAMRMLAREHFVPPPLAAFAYIDEDLALGNGRVLMEPVVLARLIQALRPAAGQRALVVGAGTGYGAAVLAACGPHVTALEEDEFLLERARAALPLSAAQWQDRIDLVAGALALGQKGPYDLILIEGAVAEIPPVIAESLRQDGGRLATIIAGRGNAARAVLAEAVPGGLRSRPIFDCAVPILPGLAKPPHFVF